MHSNSFESPDSGANGFKLQKKVIKRTFKVSFLDSKNPHFNSVYLVRVPFLSGIAVNRKSTF